MTEIKDGIVCPKRFNKKFRLLWVLKEVNDPQKEDWGPGGLCGFLKCVADKDNNCHSKWKNTYGLVVKVSHGLIRGVYSEDAESNRDVLKEIAVININKKWGVERSNDSEL